MRKSSQREQNCGFKNSKRKLYCLKCIYCIFQSFNQSKVFNKAECKVLIQPNMSSHYLDELNGSNYLTHKMHRVHNFFKIIANFLHFCVVGHSC